MRKWIFWAGIGIFVGGIVSLSLNVAVEESLSFREDVSGYALGWIGAGMILMIAGLLSNRKTSS